LAEESKTHTFECAINVPTGAVAENVPATLGPEHQDPASISSRAVLDGRTIIDEKFLAIRCPANKRFI